MFKYAFMTCTLHVFHMFDEMTVMVRLGKVKFLVYVWLNVFVIMKEMILESFTEFWAVVWRLTWKLSSEFETTFSKMKFLGCNR